MYEEVNSTPRPPENKNWYREGIKATQEKIIRKYFENKIAYPE